MIDLLAHVLVFGGGFAVGLAGYFFAAAVGRAIGTCREARDTTVEAEARHALYPAPDLDARGVVVDVVPLLDRLRPLDPPGRGMVGRDGFRNR